MLTNIKKIGSNSYGVWCIGDLIINDGLIISSIFSTNLKEENKIDTTKSYKITKIKISRTKNNNFSVYLEF